MRNVLITGATGGMVVMVETFQKWVCDATGTKKNYLHWKKL